MIIATSTVSHQMDTNQDNSVIVPAGDDGEVTHALMILCPMEYKVVSIYRGNHYKKRWVVLIAIEFCKGRRWYFFSDPRLQKAARRGNLQTRKREGYRFKRQSTTSLREFVSRKNNSQFGFVTSFSYHFS